MQIKDRVNNILSSRAKSWGPACGFRFSAWWYRGGNKIYMGDGSTLRAITLEDVFYILLLKEILSEKANLLIINPTIAITNKLILPAIIPELIPIKTDNIKVLNTIKNTHQPGGAPYNTVAWHPVHTWTPFWLSFRQYGHWMVLFSISYSSNLS